MRKLLYIILIILTASCVGNVTPRPQGVASNDSDSVQTIVTIVDTVTAEDTTLINLSPQQVDSLVFRLTHHYSENFNFIVKADFLTLIPREGDLITDTCRVYRNDIIAVAAIKALPGDTIDSIWIKVASNQTTMGWISEQELLRGTTPDDPISEILHALSSSRAVWMSAFLALGLIAIIISRRKKHDMPKMLRFSELVSPYPPLFLLLVAVMASLYASVQNFIPEFWQEYYFHPTLNPLILPPVMATLVVVMWLVIITFIAILDEIYHHLYALQGITYIAELLGLAMLVYIVISWTTLFYIGYLLLAILIIYLTKKIIIAVKHSQQ
ncbi:MAG: zinc ribbon domain-containing protein [Prevotellaceae bacterium]|nr:zinc ribbon domain-containing protein [Prevotellaceae bacterium]